MSHPESIPGQPAPEDKPPTTNLVGTLIQGADRIAKRFEHLAASLPYSSFEAPLLTSSVAPLVADLGAATWKRIGKEVPSYAFAEALGGQYRAAGAPVSALLLHWQILRRAIHLVLAEGRIRTGHGDESLLRQSSLLDYTLDWSTEASLVGYMFSAGGRPAASVRGK